jgi:hypothetical protein
VEVEKVFVNPQVFGGGDRNSIETCYLFHILISKKARNMGVFHKFTALTSSTS